MFTRLFERGKLKKKRDQRKNVCNCFNFQLEDSLIKISLITSWCIVYSGTFIGDAFRGAIRFIPVILFHTNIQPESFGCNSNAEFEVGMVKLMIWKTTLARVDG